MKIGNGGKIDWPRNLQLHFPAQLSLHLNKLVYITADATSITLSVSHYTDHSPVNTFKTLKCCHFGWKLEWPLYLFLAENFRLGTNFNPSSSTLGCKLPYSNISWRSLLDNANKITSSAKSRVELPRPSENILQHLALPRNSVHTNYKQN